MAFRTGAKVMMWRFLRRLLVQDQSGATFIELCFLAALVSVAIIGSLQLFSNQLNNTFYLVAENVVIKP